MTDPTDEQTTRSRIREQLSVRAGHCFPKDLDAHMERQAVFQVGEGLDPLDVGVALAVDDAAAVRDWLQNGRLARPSRAQVESWKASQSSLFVVIVQPWVILQPRSIPRR